MIWLQRLAISAVALGAAFWLGWTNRTIVQMQLMKHVTLRLPLGIAMAVAAGLIVVAALPWLRGLMPAVGHDPRDLLPLILPRRVRKAIGRGYEEGRLDEALRTVEAELARAPSNLGLHYWRIRLLLDTGQPERARSELIALLPRLPEAALTVRWSSLFESAGEQDLWIRDVLARIRRGHVVRRSTFRELIRLLDAAQRFEEGLEALERLRDTDPPTPEEEEDLRQAEMTMRVRWALMLREDGRGDDALREVRTVRESVSGWRSPYRVGSEILIALDRADEAVAWLLEGYRNTGDPDLLMRAYEYQRRRVDPLTLLSHWDERLGDLRDDGWLLLTTGWIALRHGLVEEGVQRLGRIAPQSPAAGHARVLVALFEAGRGHVREALAAAARALGPWYDLPFVWRCGVCETYARQAPFVCPQCRHWESFQLVRPIGDEEPALAGVFAAQPRK